MTYMGCSEQCFSIALGGGCLARPGNGKGPMSGDILGISQLEECHWHLVEEVGDAAEHLTMHRTDTLQ